MPDKNQKEQWQSADAEMQKNLPPGVKLVRTLRDFPGWLGCIAWAPDGRTLASISGHNSIQLWDVDTGLCLHTLKGHENTINEVAFDPTGLILASGSDDKTVKLWDLTSGKLLGTLQGHTGKVNCLAWSPKGQLLASGANDETIRLWIPSTGKCIREINADVVCVLTVAWSPDGSILAAGGADCSVKLWNARNCELVKELDRRINSVWQIAWSANGRSVLAGFSHNELIRWDVLTGKMLNTLEGHTDGITSLGFSFDGKIFGSSDASGEFFFWSAKTWKQISPLFGNISPKDHKLVFHGRKPIAPVFESKNKTQSPNISYRFAFNPCKPFLATVSSDPNTPERAHGQLILIFELDNAALLSQATAESVSYTSAKVVLVGDSGVGKTGLGWRLAHGEFKEHASTHGQQFWLLKQLCQQRRDGTQCEAVLWDLAGQPDYRLIHALFLDDADLVLVLFDPTRNDDPLNGVEFWLKQLKVGNQPLGGPPTILIAARSDRGTPRLTQAELEAFCKKRGVIAYLSTSAMAGDGVEELLLRMRGLIPWDGKSATITTATFKRIKDYVLELKESRRRRKVILTPVELRRSLEKTDRKWKFSNPQMLTAAGHLANHGYVTCLKTSHGEPRILLAPELLNNLAASFVLEARRNQKGLGSLEEQKLLTGGYRFPELEKITKAEQGILLDSALVLFLKHNVCFRETDPLHGRAYFVFPELINLKRPLEDDGKSVEDGVAYTVNGAVENVYASLVVLMGYTQTFTRTSQWRNHARYEVGNGRVCGFRLDEERAGELDFVLYYGTDTPTPVRMLFQSLFENFLARRNLTVRRFEPVSCSKGHQLNRAVVREQTSSGATAAFCSRCGEKISLPKADQPIQLTKQQAAEVESNRHAADQRSRFEQVLFRLKTYVTDQKTSIPECFISYAWGNPDHEQWVERNLATDLQKAGVSVVLDRWENARIGASVPRFVERVAKSSRIIVVGTPLYQKKYNNGEPMRGFVLAAEGDLIGKRMIGTEAQKETVLPVLLEGTEETAFPHLLHGRVYADFRQSECYFATAFELLMSLYQIKPQDPVAIELRESLEGRKLG